MMTRHLLYLLLSAALPMAAMAETQMKAERVALFKNGYAAVQMVGKMEDGRAQQIKGMPTPVLGTLWWQAPVGITRVDAEDAPVQKPLTTYGNAHLLQANAGKCVEMELHDGRKLSGRISLPEIATENAAGAFVSSLMRRDGDKTDFQPRFFHIQTQDGQLCTVAADSIRYLSFPAAEEPALPTGQQTARELRVWLEKEAPGEQLSMGCLSYGLSWLPVYSIHLGEDGQATLSCKAEIMNDLMDLAGVQLELVTGFPALGEALVPSPLHHAESLKDFIASLGERLRDDSALMSNYAGADFERASKSKSGKLERTEELFFYNIPGFNCKRGETKLLPMFDMTAPYKHVYTCIVMDQSTLHSLSQSGMPIAEVWHAVRLKNVGEAPWSTGTASCYAAGRFVARSTLLTTLAGHERLLPLSRTTEASVLNCREEPLPDAPRKSSDTNVYCGSLEFKNESDHEMEVELTKCIIGTPTQASGGGVINVSPNYNSNPTSTIEWKFSLPPGETQTVTYTYTFEQF